LGILLPHPILIRPLIDGATIKTQTADIVTDNNHIDNEFAGSVDNSLNRIITMKDVHQLSFEGPESLRPLQQPGSTDFISKQPLASSYSPLPPSLMANKSVAKPTASTEHLSSSHHHSVTAAATLQAISSSTSSLISLVKSSSHKISRSAHKALDKVTRVHSLSSSSHGYHSQERTHSVGYGTTLPPMDDASISQRLRHATCAVISEGYDSSNRKLLEQTRGFSFELKPPNWTKGTKANLTNPSSSQSTDREALLRQEENFRVGLELLQNDIVALSIHAGVPVSTLWPAEAVLLNLHSLMLFCRDQIKSS